MSVSVVNLQGGGGAGGTFMQTRYQESFNRADQPFFLGNNWYLQPSDANAETAASMAGKVNVSPSPAFATIGTGVNVIARSLFIPWVVNRLLITSRASTRGQYSQFTIKAIVAGVSCSIGPMVFNPNGNDGNCYILLVQSSSATVDLFRGVGTVNTLLVTNAFSVVAGDIVRIEVTPAVGSNTIRLYKNGVLQNTTVDSNAARPLTGMYGIAWFSNNVGSLSFADYDGGLL